MSVDQNMSVEQKTKRSSRIPIGDLDERYLALVRQVTASDPFKRDDDSRVLGVTSSLSGEGTTTVAANIALTVAGMASGPVLLVDANDLRPSLHKVFGLKNTIGFQNALSGGHSPLECITPTVFEGLSLTLSGKLADGEVALYSNSSIDELLDEWRDTFRWIIFDLPPSNNVTSGALLASRMDGALMVVEADRVDRKIAERTSARLRRAHANLLGAVYNKVPKHAGDLAW
ncbi:Tyrosine-protein kinase YwqD [Planctomycetes bacterium CA13]|uniref:Tyrosine-protein kinase YwqD n=1 Tax=Novipirellula herctigrandis TaxID=2527986 RepID=A0A5C5Z5M0_9BACT|nr:Tyrosine-protein kinase YwqD [Planctomycetes bacterium CA13]